MQTEAERRLALDEAPFSTPIIRDQATIRSDVWKMAWPSVLTFMLMTTNAILDRVFVGRLGRDALAAVGVGGQLMFLLVSLSMGITVGTTALVARFTGAEDPENSARATGQSITLGLIIGVACTGLVYLGVGPYLRALHLTPETAAQCRAFLIPTLIGMTPMFAVGVISAAFRGMGDTGTPLKVMICANLIHISLDWVLIFGHFGLPKLGVQGAGIALSIANTAVLFIYIALLRRSRLADALSARQLRLTLDWAKRVMKIGVPAAVTGLLRVTSLMSFTGVLSHTAERMSAVAALPIGLTAESIAFMPGFGYSIAASALVGQCLGARDPDRAERYGWAATWQAVSIMTFMGAFFFLAAEPFAHIFTKDESVARLAVSYLRIMAISEPLLGLGMVLTGALQGAGETMKPALLTAVTFWAFRLPMAWFLAIFLGYNTVGAWVAMSATTALGGILSVWLYKQDSWKQIRV